MRRKDYSKNRRRGRMWRQSLMVLFSLVILLSPFSSVGLAVFAEYDDSANDDTTVEGNVTEEGIVHESADSEIANDESDPAEYEEVASNDTESGQTSAKGDEDDQTSPEQETNDNDDGVGDGEEKETDAEEGKDSIQVRSTEESTIMRAGMQAMGQPITMQVDNTTNNDFVWSDNGNNTVTITGYTGTDTEITIPDQIDGKDVIEIGSNAFEEKQLKSVTFGDNVKTIGWSAFLKNKIEKLTIPSHIKTIGSFSFHRNDITHVTIEEGVEEIGESAFVGNNIQSVKLPTSISFIDHNPFHSNPLETVQISKNNEHYQTINDLGLYTKDGKTLVIGTRSAEIEEGTVEIGTRAFSGLDITSVMIPETVQKILSTAFSSNKLEEIDLPESLETIRDVAFYNNELTSLEIPSSVKSIGSDSFGSNNLDSVKFFRLDTNIVSSAFNYNKFNNITIYGYKDSTAEEFADEKEYTFKLLDVDANIEVEPNITVEIKNAFNETVAELKIPNTVQPANALDNATLKVTMVRPANKPGDIAGAVLDFTFIDENGNEIAVEGDFELSLLVNDPIQPNLAIFHEDHNGDWEKIGGIVQNKFITATVNNFSAYGVFVDPLPYTWTDDGTEVTITGYTGTETEIAIPNEIEGMPVTEIFHSAFKDKNLSSVVIPDSIKEIGVNAFLNNNLSEIDIPDSVEWIGQNAFTSNQIKEVHLSSNIFIHLGPSPFTSNPLEKITVDENNKDLMSIDNLGLYSKDGEYLIQGTISGIIANGTKHILESALSGLGINKLNIPDSVEIIGTAAVADNELEKVIIPRNVEFIGPSAFENNKITDVYLFHRDIKINSKAFHDNQGDSEKLNIYGYPGYEEINGGKSGESYAQDNGHMFIPFVNVGDEIIIDAGVHSIITAIDDNDTIQAKIQIPSSIANIASTNLTVKVDDASGKAPEGLNKAGAVLDISFYDGNRQVTFEDYKDNEIFTNDPFVLSLLVNDPTNPTIYHEIDEDNWEEIGGTVENNMITAEVWEFSTYGVFNEPTPPTPVREYRDIEVTKEWKGTPTDSVTVYLVINGERYEEEVAVLKESNNWSYAFFHIEISADGVAHDITVEEELVDGYETSISGSAEDGFVITNKEIIDEPEIDPCESQDPLAAGCPEDQIKDPEDDGTPKSTDDTIKPTKDGKTLPKTATSTFNFMMIGMILLVVGGATYIYFNRRQRNVSEK